MTKMTKQLKITERKERDARRESPRVNKSSLYNALQSPVPLSVAKMQEASPTDEFVTDEFVNDESMMDGAMMAECLAFDCSVNWAKMIIT